MSEAPIDRNCLSYWFPILQASGVPVPRTEIVKTDIPLIDLYEGGNPAGFLEFKDELLAAIDRISQTGPWFLRTGQGSGKHEWEKTCCLTRKADLRDHIVALVEWSDMVDILGLRTDCWVVREMLPTEPLLILPRYGGFPLVKEVRAFISAGKIDCLHNYWPLGAIDKGYGKYDPDFIRTIWNRSFVNDSEELAVREILKRVAVAFAENGAWSVDVLKTKDGRWFVTDMAEAARSYHAPECHRLNRLNEY